MSERWQLQELWLEPWLCHETLAIVWSWCHYGTETFLSFMQTAAVWTVMGAWGWGHNFMPDFQLNCKGLMQHAPEVHLLQTLQMHVWNVLLRVLIRVIAQFQWSHANFCIQDLFTLYTSSWCWLMGNPTAELTSSFNIIRNILDFSFRAGRGVIKIDIVQH